MAEDEGLFEDLQALPAGVRAVAAALRMIFGVIAAIGALAFVAHLVVFFTAMHYGANVPGGELVYRIADHGQSAYVTWGVHEMMMGLGGGVAGGCWEWMWE